jgi:WD40 repeat protein
MSSPSRPRLFLKDALRRVKVWDEESGELHRELESPRGSSFATLASFLSADGQQPRLVAGWADGTMRVYDPEAGSTLHHLQGHTRDIAGLAFIASSSAAPHHPRVVSTSWDRTAKVWDGETGEMLADLVGAGGPVTSVAVWKEHTGGHDRIASTSKGGRVVVWDGEALTLLHNLDSDLDIGRLSAFKSAEGPHRLLVVGVRGLQVWEPEEGRLLHGGINRGCPPPDNYHLFESAQGRHLLAIVSRGEKHPCHPGETGRTFLDVWDLGEAPAAEGHIRPANKHG